MYEPYAKGSGNAVKLYQYAIKRFLSLVGGILQSCGCAPGGDNRNSKINRVFL